MGLTVSGWNAIADRYGADAAREWQVLLNQFNLGHGFALIVLGVPDAAGLTLCRAELENFLAARSRTLTRIEPSYPEALGQLTPTLLETPPDRRAGAVWIAAGADATSRDHDNWRAAWHRALTSLNQQRNPFRRHFTVPVIFAGPPWLAPLMRDEAPDLWSVRALSVTIEPGPDAPATATDRPARDLEPATRAEPAGPPTHAPNPTLALAAAKRLRSAIAAATDPADVARHERSLAEVLQRAGNGLAARYAWVEAASAWREVATLRERAGAGEQAADAWTELGDVLLLSGQSEPARDAFRHGLAIRERMAQADPGNAGWQFDLCISNERLGDLLVAQGNLPEALAAYRARHAIAERLAQADPGNAFWQRDLSVSHNKLGDVLVAQGNLTEALTAYRAGFAITERLAQADPGNAGWQRDWAVSQERVGDMYARQGNTAEARRAFEGALAAYEMLVARNPGDVPSLVNSVVPHWSLANLDPAQARTHLQAALAILKPLAAANWLDAMRIKWIPQIEAQLAALK